MPKLRHLLNSTLGQDAAEFIASDRSGVDPGNRELIQLVKSSLALIDRIEDATQQRKQLSRQIGVVRKQQQDAGALIEQVAACSDNIDKFKQEFQHQLDQLPQLTEQSVPKKAAAQESTRAGSIPQHFQAAAANDDTKLAAPTVSDHWDPNAWQHYVDGHPQATIYHDSRWHALIQRQFGQTPHYLSARTPKGSISGILPLIHMNSRLFGSFTTSMPYFNYGGVLADNPATADALIEYASTHSRALQASHMELRDTQPREGLLARQHKVSMVLPLPDSDQALDSQLGSKLRAQVNRAAKNQLQFRLGKAELLNDFYKVFSHNMRDLGTPVYARSFFASIIDNFSDHTWIAVVYHDNKPKAAGFLLGYRDKLEIPWASSLRRANPLGVNMFLYRSILRQAIDLKFSYFDFGRSSIGASTHKFKRQWGAQEFPLYWHYWIRDGDQPPEVNPQNPKYQLAISMWRRLPVPLANLLGPPIVRNLP